MILTDLQTVLGSFIYALAARQRIVAMAGAGKTEELRDEGAIRP
jgi:hypothetical protein